jgi:hypothetical protein
MLTVSFPERASKIAAKASCLLILAVMLVVHPDITWLLRGLTVAAFIAGWMLTTRVSVAVQMWLALATLAPACLRLLAGREGPVLDLVWMAGVTGALLRTTPWRQWTLLYPSNLLIGGWTLTLSLAWPVLVAREIGFQLAGFYDTGAINSWSQLSGPQSAVWISYVVLAQLLGALWFEWIDQRQAQVKDPIQLLHPLWVGVTVASIVAVIQGTIDLGFLSSEFWESERRVTGTMLDANSYGMCAALAAPIGFLGMRALAPRAPAAAVAVFAVNAAGMWLSGSKTALGCGVIGAAALVVGLWRERHVSSLSSRRAALWVPAGLLAVSAIAMLTPAASPIERALEIPWGRAGLRMLWDRGGYGPIALRMTREYPLTGVGAGSYRALAPDYQRVMADEALPPDNAQNWWRHQISELGVLGGALVIAFSILVAWRVAAGREAHPDLATSSTIRGLLLGLGAASLFGMPTQNPLVLCWFFGLVASFATLVPHPSWRWRGGEHRLAWSVAAVLAIAYAAGHLWLATGSLNVVQRATYAHRDYMRGAYPPEELQEGRQFSWTRQDAEFFWAARTRFMVIRFWAPHPDIAERPVHVTLTSPCGVLFDEDLRSPASMSLGLALPEGQQTLEASLHVSRVFKPSEVGEADDRELGVGILADFSQDPAVATNQLRAVKLPGCGGGI